MARVGYLLLVCWCGVSLGHAHGINGHIHVAAWASAHFEGELAELLTDPENMDAYLFGAAFPDTGYAVDDPYGELTHWPPFVNALIEHLRSSLSPELDGPDAERRVAFLLGLASHGLQDEIFDTLFLRQVEHRDHSDQDMLDPAVDAFLFMGGDFMYAPNMYAPLEDVARALEMSAEYEVDPENIRLGMYRVKALVVDSLPGYADDVDGRFRPQLPWASRHYLDEQVPGSLRSEVPATAAYAEAVWRRLRGELPVSGRVIYGYPPRTSWSEGEEITAMDGWLTLVFGLAVVSGSLNPETVQLSDAEGRPIQADISKTRWSHGDDDLTRLVVLRPTEPLVPGAFYGVSLLPGVTFADGIRLDETWRYEFATRCFSSGDAGCDETQATDMGALDVSSRDGPAIDRGAVTELGDPDGLDGPAFDVGVAATDGRSAQMGGCAIEAVSPSPGSWLSLGVVGLFLVLGGRRSGR